MITNSDCSTIDTRETVQRNTASIFVILYQCTYWIIDLQSAMITMLCVGRYFEVVNLLILERL